MMEHRDDVDAKTGEPGRILLNFHVDDFDNMAAQVQAAGVSWLMPALFLVGSPRGSATRRPARSQRRGADVHGAHLVVVAGEECGVTGAGGVRLSVIGATAVVDELVEGLGGAGGVVAGSVDDRYTGLDELLRESRDLGGFLSVVASPLQRC